jgi:hypothetical protein
VDVHFDSFGIQLTAERFLLKLLNVQLVGVTQSLLSTLNDVGILVWKASFRPLFDWRAMESNAFFIFQILTTFERDFESTVEF